MAIMHMQQITSALLRFGAKLEEPLRRITHREQLRDIQLQNDKLPKTSGSCLPGIPESFGPKLGVQGRVNSIAALIDLQLNMDLEHAGSRRKHEKTSCRTGSLNFLQMS